MLFGAGEEGILSTWRCQRPLVSLTHTLWKTLRVGLGSTTQVRGFWRDEPSGSRHIHLSDWNSYSSVWFPNRPCAWGQIAVSLWQVNNSLIFFVSSSSFFSPTYLCIFRRPLECGSTWHQLHRLQNPAASWTSFLSASFSMIVVKDNEHKSSRKQGKILPWNVPKTDMLGSNNIRYRTRHYYLMFILEYTRMLLKIQKLIFIGLSFYQNQSKWDCQKLCILPVIACAICTVIFSKDCYY